MLRHRTRDRFDLWPRPYKLAGFATPEMRLSNDARRAVCFLGYGMGNDFDPRGTGFFVTWEGAQYLVTVKHVATGLASKGSFCMRLNRLDGLGISIEFDPEEEAYQFPWFTHPDETVDLAVMALNVNLQKESVDAVRLSPSVFDWEGEDLEVGVGDVCHAVGLFSRFSGKMRNVPIVHTGNLATLGDGERIRVRDRNSNRADAEIECEGHLVELSNLPGLSGAPVFVRPTNIVDFAGLLESGPTKFAFAAADVKLLGIWAGSWDGYEVAADRALKMELRVPVGMGFVVPATKLVELLKSEPVAAERAAFHERLRLAAIARQDENPAA